MDLTLLIISIVLCVGTLIVGVMVFMKIKNLKGDNSKEEIIKALELKTGILAGSMDSANKVIKDWADSTTTGLNIKLESLQKDNTASISALQNEVKVNLQTLIDNNDKKLEAMRSTVDEKMTKTLNERIDQSFKAVTDKLEGLHKTMGEMEQLSAGIVDLNNILGNSSKLRGNWGEDNLELIIQDSLGPDLFEKQFKYHKGCKEGVDFAIKLPGNDGKSKLYLPIDAKFPIDDYLRVNECRAKGDKDGIVAQTKELAKAIKAEANSISKKYIQVPITTDFAIMFLPSEGLYAEVVSIPGLAKEVQKDFKIIITGPTTIAALLQSLRIGFKTMQIQKSSHEIIDFLRGFAHEFDKFFKEITTAKNQITTAGNSMGVVFDKSGKIKNQLDRMSTISGEEDNTPIISSSDSSETE